MLSIIEVDKVIINQRRMNDMAQTEKGFTITKFTRKGELGLHITSNQFFVTHDTALNEYTYFLEEQERQGQIVSYIEWIKSGYWDDKSFEIIEDGEADF